MLRKMIAYENNNTIIVFKLQKFENKLHSVSYWSV